MDLESQQRTRDPYKYNRYPNNVQAMQRPYPSDLFDGKRKDKYITNIKTVDPKKVYLFYSPEKVIFFLTGISDSAKFFFKIFTLLLNNKKLNILEIFCGKMFATKQYLDVSNSLINSWIATDIMSPLNSPEDLYKQENFYFFQMDCLESVQKFNDIDVLFMISPPFEENDPFVYGDLFSIQHFIDTNLDSEESKYIYIIGNVGAGDMSPGALKFLFEHSNLEIIFRYILDFSDLYMSNKEILIFRVRNQSSQPIQYIDICNYCKKLNLEMDIYKCDSDSYYNGRYCNNECYCKQAFSNQTKTVNYSNSKGEHFQFIPEKKSNNSFYYSDRYYIELYSREIEYPKAIKQEYDFIDKKTEIFNDFIDKKTEISNIKKLFTNKQTETQLKQQKLNSLYNKK